MNQSYVQELKLDEAAITDNLAAYARLERAQFLARPSVMLGLVPIPDGTKWSVLYGSNIMEGVVGFGHTPDEAMADFDHAWREERAPEARR